MNLGIAIRQLRMSQGLTQVALAKKAKLTQTTLSKIETGKRPNDTTLRCIANALQVPVSLLFVMGIEKGDVPAKKRPLYEKLFPLIKTMVTRIAVNEK